MPRLFFWQFHVGEFLSTTTHLTLEQRGAYIVLLSCMWQAGGKLPNDPAKLARMCGVTMPRWNKISADVLEFFDREGELLSQKRLTAEYEKQIEIVEQRRSAGRKGATVKSLKSRDADLANAAAPALAKPQHLESESESELQLEIDSEPKEDSSQQLVATDLNPSSKKGNGRRRKVKTDLPDDWLLSTQQWEYAASVGMSADQIQAMERKLKRWVKSEGKRSADWGIFIENWIDREISFLRKQPSSGGTAGDDRSGFFDYARETSRGS